MASVYGVSRNLLRSNKAIVEAPLFSRNPHPSEAEIKYAIEGNVCRCTGYHKIIDAIAAAAANSAGNAE